MGKKINVRLAQKITESREEKRKIIDVRHKLAHYTNALINLPFTNNSYYALLYTCILEVKVVCSFFSHSDKLIIRIKIRAMQTC